jgi:hypothetical protein
MAEAGFLERFADLWTPEPNTGCYVWLGPMGAKRSGARKYYKGTNATVCRAILIEQAGEPPTSKHHAAHNTLGGCCGADAGCVNPHHLRWATARENVLDIPARQRSARVRKGRAVMTVERRSEIASKGYYARTPGQRIAMACAGAASLTEEQRRSAARKGHLARRQMEQK